MQIQDHVSLRVYNTFGIDVAAEHFAEIHNENELREVVMLPYELHVLGGGSNILLSGRVGGCVLHNKIKGIAIWKEDDDHVWLDVGGGEIWHELVLYAIERGWGGIENLALIPGTVGAAPIQNIGAYGVEAKEVIEEVRFYDLKEKEIKTFSNSQCRFGYRDSIFKQELKGRVFITSVRIRLNKKPVFNTTYGAIEQELAVMGGQELSVKAIAQAVINIRSSKLPNPREIGNAGSFFKNPTIARGQYEVLLQQYANMPHYAVSETMVKVPAGWLIEQCGWKGYRKGDAGVHAKQALVLVNYGNASGDELWQLSGEIVSSVVERFGIELEREVQVW